jgi:hypothetical protein
MALFMLVPISMWFGSSIAPAVQIHRTQSLKQLPSFMGGRRHC